MKTIVITGATSGIGRAALEEMAARGWMAIGVGRNLERCNKAEEEIKSYYPDAKLKFFTCDLSKQKEVNCLAEDIIRFLDSDCEGKLDVLVNNAGCVNVWYVATEDGYETQFAVNYLSGFLLANRLMGKLKESPCGRVLTVSSGSHYGTKVNWNDIMLQKHYNCLSAYKQSKLCNVLFTNEFNRRMAGENIRAFAVDPGLVNTGIGTKGTSGLVSWFWKKRGRHGLSPYQAACTITFLCKMPKNFKPAITYFKNCKEQAPSKASLDEASGRKLWELSEKLCGLTNKDGGKDE